MPARKPAQFSGAAMPSAATLLGTRLRGLANPRAAASMRAYLRDQFVFLGLPAPVRRAAVRDLILSHPGEAQALIETAGALWDQPERELRYTAVDLLRHHHKALDASHLETLQAWMLRDAWWETVDSLTAVIGKIVLGDRKHGGDAQGLMDRWLEHSDFWVRRAAMLHQLGWRRDTDLDRLRRYALQLAPEREFFIRKAIGWALRDYARHDPTWVATFVRKHARVLSPLAQREACRHLAIA